MSVEELVKQTARTTGKLATSSPAILFSLVVTLAALTSSAYFMWDLSKTQQTVMRAMLNEQTASTKWLKEQIIEKQEEAVERGIMFVLKHLEHERETTKINQRVKRTNDLLRYFSRTRRALKPPDPDTNVFDRLNEE